MNVKRRILSCSISALVTMVTVPAFADCSALPEFSQLRSALAGAITPAAGANGGLGFHMWGTLVANDGTVCAVAVAAQHAIPVQSTAASVARSRRDLGIFVAAYGVS